MNNNATFVTPELSLEQDLTNWRTNRKGWTTTRRTCCHSPDNAVAKCRHWDSLHHHTLRTNRRMDGFSSECMLPLTTSSQYSIFSFSLSLLHTLCLSISLSFPFSQSLSLSLYDLYLCIVKVNPTLYITNKFFPPFPLLS